MHDAGALLYSPGAYSSFRAGSVAERPLWEQVSLASPPVCAISISLASVPLCALFVLALAYAIAY